MTSTPRLTRYGVAVLVILLACTRSEAPPTVAQEAPAPAPQPPITTQVPSATPQGQAAPAPATPGASPSGRPDAATPAVPPGPAPIPVRSAVAVVPGAEVVLGPAATVIVDPRASFRIEVGTVLADGRLSLRDDQDAMVPSSGTTEVGASWTRFQLVPDAPLVPGSSYTLHVDGNASHAPHDPSGQAFRPLALHVRTAGERPLLKTKRRGPRR